MKDLSGRIYMLNNQTYIELKNRVKELEQELHERNTFEEGILSNLKMLIEPYIIKLRSGNFSKSKSVYFNIPGFNLKEIISPFALGLS